MQTGPPIIGVTTYGESAQHDFALPVGYVRAVRRAGGVPVLIPPGEMQARAVLSLMDGLILAGGGDICPSRYGGAEHDTIYNLDHERDESELELVRQAVIHQKPMLAICRGLQVLNVALGGSLHSHVPDIVGESVLHRLPPRLPTSHEVHIVPASRLVDLVGAETLDCRSWHHQAIDRLGAGLVAVAHAADGLIEAVEMPRHPQLLAVQWHPELSAETDDRQQQLFNVLVQWARQRRVPCDTPGTDRGVTACG